MKDLRLHPLPCRILYIGILIVLAELCYVLHYAATSTDLLVGLRAQGMLSYLLLSHTLLVGGCFLFDLVIREQDNA